MSPIPHFTRATEDMPETNNSGGYPLSASRILRFLAAATAVALVVVPSALAGKPGGGGGGGLALVLATDANANGVPNHGDTITFNVSTSATSQPHVSVTCSQNGTIVYSSSAGFYEGYPWPWAQYFTLSSRAWSAGAASCKAALTYSDGRRTRQLASLSFAVQA